MREIFSCGDGASLAAYLYGECDAGERAAIESHLAACTDCTRELEGLAGARRVLAGWRPPDVELGFRLAPSPAVSVRGRDAHHGWWQQPLPAWAQLAAAVLIFAAGLAVGASRSSGTAQVVANPPIPAALETAMAALDTRLKGLEAANAASSRAVAPVRAAAPDLRALMPRIRAEIAESENRMRAELATGLISLKAEENRVRQYFSQEIDARLNDHTRILLTSVDNAP